jgi:hypothetical protein
MASSDKSLVTPWVLYEHPPGTTDWSLASYKKIATIRTVEEASALLRALAVDADKITGAYLCLMREGVAPVYESPENKEGGALTIRIGPDTARSFWLMFASHAVCEELLAPKSDIHSTNIHGIVISPKRGNIIIQVWTRETMSATNLNPVVRLPIQGDILYRPHYERV